MSEEQQSKKFRLVLVLSWIFGVLFALIGILFVFSEPIPGIVMLVMAAILLPPVKKIVDKKFKFHFSGGIKIFVIIIGFIIFCLTVDTSNTTKQKDNQLQEQQEQKQQQSISETEQPKEESEPTKEEQKQIQEQPQKYDLSKVDYQIVKTEDFSIPTANRFAISVLINNNPATEEQIKAVSEKIVNDYKDKADAISILFYFDESQIDGAYTLAKADWAPEGDWSKADLKANQKLVYDFKDIVGEKRTNEPTALEREINKAMKDLWYEMMETNDFVTDKDVAKILAPQYNKTVEEMLEIRQRVNNYDFGL